MSMINDNNKYLENIELETDSRTTALPVKYQHIYDHYKRQEANFWTDEEFEMDMRQDPIDREKVSPEMKRLFDYVQAAFAVSDYVVNETVGEKILARIKSTDIIMLYQFQIMMENIHSITYAKVLDNAIRDPEEKKAVLQEAMSIPTIKAKVDWIRRWTEVPEFEGLSAQTIKGLQSLVDKHQYMIDFASNVKDNFSYLTPVHIKHVEDELDKLKRKRDRPSLDRLIIANAIMEGVFFQGNFAIIIWFAQQGLFPGAAKVNEQIRRDEGQHVETAIMIHNTLIKYKENFKVVKKMVKEAVEIECDFMAAAMPSGLRGMNSNLMQYYLEYVADWLLQSLGYTKIYNRTLDESFPFMKKSALSNTFSDFFKTEELSYKKHGEGETAEDQEVDFYSSEDSQ